MNPGRTKATQELQAQPDVVNVLAQLNPLFRSSRYSIYLTPPELFPLLSQTIGRERVLSYQSLRDSSDREVDLDGRDVHYWQIVVLDDELQQLAGGGRLCFSKWHGLSWDGSCSYLEHCYPGLDQLLRRDKISYVEAGRFFVAKPYQHLGTVLLQLMRAGVMAAVDSEHDIIIGMVSYNHQNYPSSLSKAFLARLLTPPYHGDLLSSELRPRYPVEDLPIGPPREAGLMPSHTYQNLQRALQQLDREACFEIPVIIRNYSSFTNAKVSNFSIARDFNQVTEILMYSEVKSLSARQRARLVIDEHAKGWQEVSHSWQQTHQRHLV